MSQKRSRLARAVVSAAVAAGLLIYGLPRVGDLSQAWTHLEQMTAASIAMLAIAAALNLVTYWWLLVVATPGLTLAQAAVACEASTAVNNVLPGGGAAGAGVTWSIYRSFGFSGEEITRSLSLTMFWNTAVKLVTPALALVLLWAGSDAPPPLLAASSLVVLFLATGLAIALLGQERLLDRVVGLAARVSRRRVDAGDWVTRVREARHRSLSIVRRRWVVLSTAALASHAALFVVLLVSLRAVGIGDDAVGFGEVLTAFALVRIALIIPLTPGGAGVAEVGLAALLTEAGGESSAVVGAVLAFRALTWFLPIPIGAAAYGGWLLSRRHSSTASAP